MDLKIFDKLKVLGQIEAHNETDNGGWIWECSERRRGIIFSRAWSGLEIGTKDPLWDWCVLNRGIRASNGSVHLWWRLLVMRFYQSEEYVRENTSLGGDTYKIGRAILFLISTY